jgi:hypothetical protein
VNFLIDVPTTAATVIFISNLGLVIELEHWTVVPELHEVVEQRSSVSAPVAESAT